MKPVSQRRTKRKWKSSRSGSRKGDTTSKAFLDLEKARQASLHTAFLDILESTTNTSRRNSEARSLHCCLRYDAVGMMTWFSRGLMSWSRCLTSAWSRCLVRHVVDIYFMELGMTIDLVVAVAEGCCELRIFTLLLQTQPSQNRATLAFSMTRRTSETKTWMK